MVINVTKRGLVEKDNPMQRYNDIIEIYKNGLTAECFYRTMGHTEWSRYGCYYFKGDDWNYDKHQIIEYETDFKGFQKDCLWLSCLGSFWTAETTK